MREGWKVTKMIEVFELQMGKTPSRDIPAYWGGTEPWVSIGDMGASKFISSTKENITNQAVIDSGIKLVPKGTVIMSFKLSVGKVAIAAKPIYTNEAIMSFKPRSGFSLYPDYIYYYLKGYKWDGVNRAAMGLTLNKASISQGQFAFPSLSEQERIVAELDLLQGIIDKQKAQLKELDTLAQSIFYDMFQHEHGQVVKLHDVCSIVSGLVNPNEEPYCNYPHIGGANIESGTGVFINVKLAKEENLISGKYLFDETMILYSKIRPNLNKVALPSFVGICSADMYPIIPDRDRIDRTFLKFVLSQPDFLEYAISHSGRANIPKINREDLMDYSFMSYSLSLQQAFATKIEAIEHQKASINASIAETQKLFDYTMDKYFG